MNTEPAVDVFNLSVQYGRKLILDGISFRVKQGSVYALLGRNGSGKSSLVRALLGMQRPTEGRLIIFGEDSWIHRSRILARVGVVAEDDEVERGMTVRQLVDFNRAIYPRWNASIIQTRLDLLKIRPSAKFGELSKGQRRQLLLALAITAEPDLLVLDDPTLGLDVVARKDLYDDLLADLADRGTTTLITSHDLAGIEGIADRVGILSGTRLLLDEDLETVKSRFRRMRRAQTAITTRHLEVVRSQRWGDWIEEIVANYEAPEPDGESSEVVAMSLEEIFMAVTGERES